MHGSVTTPASAADLAARDDFTLGETLIRPATRAVEGPGGVATIEPRVMQVLTALADAGGAVVTRDELGRRCWNGQFVGDDALNRAIGEVRRVARTAGAGGFGVETIPKVGYRLIGAVPDAVAPAPSAPASPAMLPLLSRRMLIGGGIVSGIAATGGIIAWGARPPANVARAAALLAEGEAALKAGMPESAAQGVGFLREAVALDPGNARAWGKLALALRAEAEYAPPAATAAAVADCERAARHALALDASQADAHAALALLAPTFGDWSAAERRIRAVLALDPAHVPSTAALAVLMMGVGRVRDSERLGAWLAEREPLSPDYQYRRVYGLWGAGRIGDADRTADRALQLWPRHPGVWFARLWSLAFTGRTAAALAHVRDVAAAPAMLPPKALAMLGRSIDALHSRAPAALSAAIAENLAAATRGHSGSVNAVMLLTAFGALDAAYEVAHGYLLRRGPLVVQYRLTAGEPSVNDQHRRKTMMLFVPVTAPMRADRRFLPLMRGIGLNDYWRQSGTRPDFLGNRRLPA